MTPLDRISQLTDENAQLRADLARVTAERDGYRSDIDRYTWNLAGCDTIASGWGKPGDYNKEMALPALDSVSRMAQDLAALRARVADLEADASLHWITEEEVRQSRARVAELVAALRELHWRFKDIPDGCDHSVGVCWCSEIAALDKAAGLLARAESASPAEHPDTERLDWLEAQPSKYEWAVTLDHGCVFVTRNKTSGRPSIRAAIDQARAAK